MVSGLTVTEPRLALRRSESRQTAACAGGGHMDENVIQSLDVELQVPPDPLTSHDT